MKHRLALTLACFALAATASAQTFTLDGQGGTQPVPPIGQNPASDTLFQPVVAVGFARFATSAGTQFTGTGADVVNALTFGYDGQAQFGGAGVIITEVYFSVDRIAFGRVGTGSRSESIVGIQPPASDVGQASDIYYSAVNGTHNVHIDDNGFLTGGASDHPAWLANGNLINGLGDAGDGVLGNGVINGESYNIAGLDMRNAAPGTGLGSIYYSVEGSADILFGAIGNSFNAAPSTYATAAQLGLQPGDDINGLTIVDYDGDVTSFNSAQDYVYFTLARGSASFSGDNQAGDIWLVGAGLAVPAVIIDEELLGFDVAPGGTSGIDLGLAAAPNSSPTDVALSTNAVAENQSAGTTVGNFSTTDPDVGDTHSYSLVDVGSFPDNASFQIVGDALQTAAVFDYETKNSYSIKVRTTDVGGLWYEEVFTINVTDVGGVWVVAAADWTAAGLTIVVDGGLVHVYHTGGTTDAVVPMGASDITGITVTGRVGAADELIIDYSGGDPLPANGVDYEGGTGGNDTLAITGGGFATVTHTCNNANDGSIAIDGKVITYTGLEPVDMTGSTATDFIFNLPVGSDNAELSDIGGGNLRLESADAVPTFESTDFAAPTGSITINGGAGDTVTGTTALTMAFDLSITADDAGFNGALDLGGKTLTLDVAGHSGVVAGAVSVAGGALVKTGTGTVTIAGAMTGAGFTGTVNAGALALSNNGNNFTGPVNVNAGTVIALANNALGAAAGETIVQNGASLMLEGGVTLSESLRVSGYGVDGDGAVVGLSGDNALTGALAGPGVGQIGVGARAGSLRVDGSVDIALADLTFFGDGNIIVNGDIAGSGGPGIQPGGIRGEFIDIDDGAALVGNRTGNGDHLFFTLDPYAGPGVSDFVLQRHGITPTGDAVGVITPRIDFGTGTDVIQGDGSVLDRGGYASGSVPPWQGLFNDQGLTADMDGDQIAAAWSGRIMVTSGGTYTFTTRSDDGSVLFINGRRMANNNTFQGMTNRGGSIDLAPGLHDISIGFYEGGGGAGVQASYSGPDTGDTRVIIPPSVLFNDVATPGTYVSGGLRGDYYDLNNAADNGGFNVAADEYLLFPTDPGDSIVMESLRVAVTSVVSHIDFGTGTEVFPGDGTVLDRGVTSSNLYGGVGVDVGLDQVGAVFDGHLVVPETAQYQFTTRSDDHSHVYVDVDGNGAFDPTTERVASKGAGGMVNATAGPVSLVAGTHAFKAITGEGSGGAGFQVSWEQLTGGGAFSRQIIGPNALAVEDIFTVVSASGGGTVTLAGSNTYNASTAIDGGTLLVNGAHTGGGGYTVASGGLLGGTGSTESMVDVDGGTLAPGVSPGILSVGNLLLDAGSTFSVELGGTTDGNGSGFHDQLVVTGGVTIAAGAALDPVLFGGFVPSPGDTFTIIDNDGTDAVTGTFEYAGMTLNEGDQFIKDDFAYGISYVGNDGNDVDLAVISRATVYVDDSFTQTNGGAIADADLGTAGNQAAVMGVDAFTTIGSALSAVSTSGTIIVNGGAYAETIAVDSARTLEITGPDAVQAVTIDALSGVTGTTVTIEGDSILTIGDANDQTIAGAVNGSGSLVKQGTGKVTLLGTGIQFTGDLTVSQGTATLDDATSFANGADPEMTMALASNATLEFAVSGDHKIGTSGGTGAGVTITGWGTLQKTGVGQLNFGDQGSAAFKVNMEMGSGGLIDVREGTIRNGGWQGQTWTSNLADLNVDAGATFDAWDGITVRVDAVTGDGTITRGIGGGGSVATLIVGVDNGSGDFSGMMGVVANGRIHLQKEGSGTQTLSGTLDNSAATAVVNGGTLVLGKTSSGAVHALGGGGTVLTVNSNGTARLAGSGDDQIYQDGDVVVNADGILDLNGMVEGIDILSGNGTIDNSAIAAATLIIGEGNNGGTFSGVIQDTGGALRLVKTGAADNVALTGTANTHEGGTEINQGVMRVVGDGTLGSVSGPLTLRDGGVMQNNNSVVSLDVNRTVDLANGNGCFRSGWGKTITVNGPITGPGNLRVVNDGAAIILTNPANDYDGDTIVGGDATVGGWGGGGTATLRLGAANVIPNGAGKGNVLFDSATQNEFLDLNGFDERINGLSRLSGSAFVQNSTGNATLTVGDNDATSTYNGVIRDSGGTLALTKTGNGTLTLAAGNTYTGSTAVDDGVLQFGAGGTIAAASAIAVNADGPATGDPATLRLSRHDIWGNHTTTSSSQITVHEGGLLETDNSFNTLVDLALDGGTVVLNGGASPSFPALALKGTVSVTTNSAINVGAGANNVISIGVTAAAGATVFDVAGAAVLVNNAPLKNNRDDGSSGELPSQLAKTGTGTLELKAASTYSGLTTVDAGALQVDNTSGSATGSGDVNVESGATLAGSGSVAGAVTSTGGTVTPGMDSPEDIATGDLSLDGSSTYPVQLNGAIPGTGHDQLAVTGTVDLNGATLDATLGYAPGIADTYVIIDNDPADSVSGTFAGMAEGYIFRLSFGGSDYVFQISYVGGDGNDVVISVVPERTLTIVSARGTATPSVGTHTNLYGAVLTNSVTSPVTLANVEYVCTGWTMAGNAPVVGSTNVMVMTHTNDATLIWLWQTNALNDFGDLPPAYAITVPGENGARHSIPDSGGILLGVAIDAETNGLPSAAADGDDSDGTDDEDGIVVVGGWQEGPSGGAIEVAVSGGSGYLSGWIDWDGNNQFTDPGDQVLDMAPVVAGVQTNTFAVPAGVFTNSAAHPRFARFRLWTNSTPALMLTGLVANGEVEDYELPVMIENVPPVVAGDITGAVAQVGAVVSVLINDTDADGDPLLVTNVTQGARGVVAITGGGSNVTYTANAGEAGYDQFTYWVTDGRGGWATGVVTIAIDPQVVYVSTTGSNVWPYADWANAATAIQTAVDAVVPSGMVWVTNGTYSTGGATVDGMPCRVALTNPVTVASVNGDALTTIAGLGPVGPGAVRCLYMTNGVVVSGFTLSNGYTQAGMVEALNSGGGVRMHNGGVLSNCVVRSNGASVRGGGVFCDGGGTVQGCTVRGNSAGMGGGVSLHDGGVIACEIFANSATADGGGIHVGSPGLIRNSLVVSNTAPLGGGMSLVSTGLVAATVQNCTVCSNSATSGGGIHTSSVLTGPSIANTIVYYNSATLLGANWLDIGPAPATYTHVCTTPTNGLAGTGNIADEPEFSRNRAGGYRLRASSPCKNTGMNEPWMVGDVDLVGAVRIVAAVVDRGCYEYPNATDVVLYQFWLTQNDGRVVVRWQTASEVGTLGFMLYREADGAWILVNSDGMIPAKGAPLGGIGASYAYIDVGADPDATHTYKLVEIMNQGTQEYGPFQRSVYELRLVSPLTPTAEGIAIRWLSREGDVYRVFQSADLRGDFEPLSGPLSATPPQNVYIDRTGGSGARYYQVRLEK